MYDIDALYSFFTALSKFLLWLDSLFRKFRLICIAVLVVVILWLLACAFARARHYRKIGYNPVTAFIPIVNRYVLCTACKRNRVLVLLVPVPTILLLAILAGHLGVFTVLLWLVIKCVNCIARLVCYIDLLGAGKGLVAWLCPVLGFSIA